jgi:hypothetical protein
MLMVSHAGRHASTEPGAVTVRFALPCRRLAAGCTIAPASSVTMDVLLTVLGRTTIESRDVPRRETHLLQAMIGHRDNPTATVYVPQRGYGRSG